MAYSIMGHMRLYSQNIWGNFAPSECVANRNQLIQKLIGKYSPDICTFQECNPETSRAGECDIAKLLSDEYAEAASENAMRNFTPVFYKKDRFECIASGYEAFEGLNDIGSKSFTYAVLRDKNGRKFAVVCMHFWWKYLSREDEEQRLLNAQRVKKLCEWLKSEYNVPILLAGDLNNGKNALQGDETYRRMLTLGFSDVRHLSPVTTDSFTRHEYPVRGRDGNYRYDGPPASQTIDYVFLYNGDGVRARRFAVLTEQDALDSSDHCPLLFDMEIL